MFVFAVLLFCFSSRFIVSRNIWALWWERIFFQGQNSEQISIHVCCYCYTLYLYQFLFHFYFYFDLMMLHFTSIWSNKVSSSSSRVPVPSLQTKVICINLRDTRSKIEKKQHTQSYMCNMHDFNHVYFSIWNCLLVQSIRWTEWEYSSLPVLVCLCICVNNLWSEMDEDVDCLTNIGRLSIFFAINQRLSNESQCYFWEFDDSALFMPISVCKLRDKCVYELNWANNHQPINFLYFKRIYSLNRMIAFVFCIANYLFATSNSWCHMYVSWQTNF